MNEFKYGSLRAKYARLGHSLNKAPIFMLLWLGIFVPIVFGIMLLIQKNTLGWLLFIVTIISIMALTIIKLLLVKVPLGKTDDINDILSSNSLSIMDKNPTPKELAEKLIDTRSAPHRRICHPYKRC